MEEPFGGAMAMDERTNHPQVLLSKGKRHDRRRAGPRPGADPPKTAWPEPNAGCGLGPGASREDAGGTSTFVIP